MRPLQVIKYKARFRTTPILFKSANSREWVLLAPMILLAEV